MSARDERLLAVMGLRRVDVAELLNIQRQTVGQGINRPNDYLRGDTLERLRIALLESGQEDRVEQLMAFCAEESARKIEEMDRPESKRRYSSDLHEFFFANNRSSLAIWGLAGDGELIDRINSESATLLNALTAQAASSRKLVILGSEASLAQIKTLVFEKVIAETASLLIGGKELHALTALLSPQTQSIQLVEYDWPDFAHELLLLRRKVSISGFVFTKKGFMAIESGLATTWMKKLEGVLDDARTIYSNESLRYLICCEVWRKLIIDADLGHFMEGAVGKIQSCLEDPGFYSDHQVRWQAIAESIGLKISFSGSYHPLSAIQAFHQSFESLFNHADEHAKARWSDVGNQLMAIQISLI